MAELIHDFLQLQAQIKLYHWQTKSHARHVASDKLSSSLAETIDKFVEVYIGKYERPMLKGPTCVFRLENKTDSSILDYINTWITYLEKTLPSMLSKNDTDLLNIRDEMLGDLNQTKYLFTLS